MQMWVRKTAEQMAMERDRIRLSFRGPAAWFAICLLLNTVMIFGKACTSIDSKTLYGMFLIAIALATLVAIVGYVRQIIHGKTLDSLSIRIVICDRCHRVKRRDGEVKCECGGTFDDFDKWTWIDGDENAGQRE
jgi:hypothetical protein